MEIEGKGKLEMGFLQGQKTSVMDMSDGLTRGFLS